MRVAKAELAAEYSPGEDGSTRHWYALPTAKRHPGPTSQGRGVCRSFSVGDLPNISALISARGSPNTATARFRPAADVLTDWRQPSLHHDVGAVG
jgi:hypothetical protein